MMSLGQRLQDCRNKLHWTQLQVATAIKVPRELLSMWENDVRRPNVRQLEDLAQLFDRSASYLLEGKETVREQGRPRLLLRGLDNASPELKLEVDHWLSFLDEWSKVLSLVEDLPGRAKPQKSIDRGPDFSDIRSASKLASDVRECYGLGLFALPDLYTFLDEQKILVCQAKLGSIGDGNQGVSGAFYNHPKLGFCILINAQTSRGRQMFTLAHEFAHALFHYGDCDCIIKYGEDSSREQFADAFASQFLVPAKGLKHILNADNQPPLTEYGVLWLAHYYNVSYAFMLNRLAFEGILKQEQKRCWQELSPRSLARHVGLDPELFKSRADAEPYLSRYPGSLLQKIKSLIDTDKLYVSEAASLLKIDAVTLQVELLRQPCQAEEDERQETKEFAEAYGSQDR
jgi:Zn-dependent peptidase ImmA (M78 family)/transcriptional regulator with XRE-family HTH domain